MTARLTSLQSELAVGVHLDVLTDAGTIVAGSVLSIDAAGDTATVVVGLDDGGPVTVVVPVGAPPAPGAPLDVSVLEVAE